MMNRLGSLLTLLFLCVAFPCLSIAQQVRPATTTNRSVVITAGNTFQTILAAQERISITIQNNMTSADNCWITFGVGVTAGNATKAASILLTPGQAWTRYYPFIPNDAIQGTCTSTNDTMYVDTQ